MRALHPASRSPLVDPAETAPRIIAADDDGSLLRSVGRQNAQDTRAVNLHSDWRSHSGAAQDGRAANRCRESGGVLIVVQDSGSGFEAAMLERSFEPFYARTQTGLGVGLSICRLIIKI